MRIINLTNSVINWAPTSCNVNPNEISGEFTALRTAVEGHVPPMVNMYGTKFLVVISSEEKAKYPKLFGIVVPAENIVNADTLKPVEGDVPEGYEKISDSEGNEFVYKVPEKCSFDQVQSDWTEQDTNSPSYIKNKPTVNNDTGVVNLGEFQTYGLAEIKAKEVAKISKNCVLVFTVPNSGNGIIINNVAKDGSVTQLYYFNGKEYKRTISVDNEDTNWVELTKYNGVIKGKFINFRNLVKLKTTASSEEIKECLGSVKVSDLDECLSTGKLILDNVSQLGISIGWTGSAWIFKLIGNYNMPMNTELYGGVAIVKIENETYSILSNSESGKLLTENSSAYTSIIERLEALEQKLSDPK